MDCFWRKISVVMVAIMQLLMLHSEGEQAGVCRENGRLFRQEAKEAHTRRFGHF
eukprot:c39143_g1_i1 orf=3-161(-)